MVVFEGPALFLNNTGLFGPLFFLYLQSATFQATVVFETNYATVGGSAMLVLGANSTIMFNAPVAISGGRGMLGTSLGAVTAIGPQVRLQ